MRDIRMSEAEKTAMHLFSFSPERMRTFTIRYTIGEGKIERKFYFDKITGLNMDPERNITGLTDKQYRKRIKAGEKCEFEFCLLDLYEMMKHIDQFMKYHPEYKFKIYDESEARKLNRNKKKDSTATKEKAEPEKLTYAIAVGRNQQWVLREKYKVVYELLSNKKLSNRIRISA